jgi:alpha-beta hydrolase superfamily lysophospholipase
LYEPVNKAATKVIVLLPGLGETRGVYPNTLIQKLHDQIPDAVVLAIDMRGHGDSTNLGTWKDFGTAEFKDMKTDVLSVPEYIDPYYPNVKDYYVVGASMGSSAALNAGAQKNQITKIAMISPGIEYEGVNLERAADDYVHPLLLVAASGDSYSASSAGQIKSISPRPNVELKIYQGISAHGTDLFGATQSYEDSLEDELVEFLK